MIDTPKAHFISEQALKEAFRDQVLTGTGYVKVERIDPKVFTGQSRRHSLFESITNIVVGFGISTGANMIVLPWFGHTPNWSEAAGIGGVLTIVSIIRSYVLRRIYNQIYIKTGY